MSNNFDAYIEFKNKISAIKNGIEKILQGMKTPDFITTVNALSNVEVDNGSLFEMISSIHENTATILSIILSEVENTKVTNKISVAPIMGIYAELNILYALLKKIADIPSMNEYAERGSTYYLLALGVLNKTQSMKFEVIFSNKFSVTLDTTDRFIKATKTIDQIESADVYLKSCRIDADKVLEDMKLTAAAVSREGLTRSFKDSMDELSVSIKFLDKINYYSIGGMVVITLAIIIASFVLETKESIAYERFLLITPLIFLSWFVSKRSQFLYQIKEEYSYKYATALAYEGYKDEIAKQSDRNKDDNKMRDKLMEVTIDNLARSPLEQFDKNSDHAPYAQFIRKFENKQSS